MTTLQPPVLITTVTSNSPTKEQLSLLNRPSTVPVDNQFVDDIKCEEWLEEINLVQYTNAILTNCKSKKNSCLSREILSRIRVQDFTSMNICDFEHQKLLMKHINISLKYAFNSKIRKHETVRILENFKHKVPKIEVLLFPPVLNEGDDHLGV